MDPTRPSGPTVLPLAPGDVVRLRRAHPCGAATWRVTRTGADIGIACTGCGRRILVDRRDLERRVLSVTPAVPAPVDPPG